VGFATPQCSDESRIGTLIACTRKSGLDLALDPEPMVAVEFGVDETPAQP